MEEYINKIINDDCLNILPKIPDNSIDLIVTDPPYAISQDGKEIVRNNFKSGMLNRKKNISFDYGDWDKFIDDKDFFNFTELWFKECARILKPKSWIFIFFDKQKMGYFDLMLALKYKIQARNIYIWCKTNPLPSFRKVQFLSGTEFIWVGSKYVEENKGCKIKNFLMQKEMMSYMITPNKSAYGVTEHPTEKPEKLIERFILTGSNENDVVLDCFGGSGTTGAVCKRLNRKYILIEQDKKYCDMAEERIKKIRPKSNIFDVLT